MQFKTIRWLASVGLGFALGVAAAKTDFSSLSMADVSTEALGEPARSCNEGDGNSPCCSSGAAKEDLLAPDPTPGSPEAPIAPAPVEAPVEEPSTPSPTRD